MLEIRILRNLTCDKFLLVTFPSEGGSQYPASSGGCGLWSGFCGHSMSHIPAPAHMHGTWASWSCGWQPRDNWAPSWLPEKPEREPHKAHGDSDLGLWEVGTRPISLAGHAQAQPQASCVSVLQASRRWGRNPWTLRWVPLVPVPPSQS